MGLLAGEDGGLVAVHGLAAFAWDAGRGGRDRRSYGPSDQAGHLVGRKLST